MFAFRSYLMKINAKRKADGKPVIGVAVKSGLFQIQEVSYTGKTTKVVPITTWMQEREIVSVLAGM